MEITWHDNTCFLFRDKAASLVINPQKESGKIKAEVVLTSSQQLASEIEGDFKVFNWPGEYEVKDIPLNAYSAKTTGKDEGENTLIFFFEIGGIKVCHLGELGHTLTSEMVNEIGDVDILIVKLGENSNLDSKKAMEIIEAIEPRVLIPMGTGDLTKALKSIDATDVVSEDKFVIKSVSELPEDQMKYVLLNRA